MANERLRMASSSQQARAIARGEISSAELRISVHTAAEFDLMRE